VTCQLCLVGSYMAQLHRKKIIVKSEDFDNKCVFGQPPGMCCELFWAHPGYMEKKIEFAQYYQVK
jgi:hypothetical protein